MISMSFIFLLMIWFAESVTSFRVTSIRRSLIRGCESAAVLLTNAAVSNAALVPIPVDISSTDSKVANIADVVGGGSESLVPDISIVNLEGGGNLGLILWAFLLYQGLVPDRGRPAEWILPFVVKILNAEEDQWYKDHQDGYDFTVPPTAEAVRTAIFFAAGYYVNLLVLNSFDNDAFWCWSIAGSLSIPAGMFSLARPKPVSRKTAELEQSIRADFAEFAKVRLTRVKTKLSSAKNFEANMKVTDLTRDKNCVQEDFIVLAFRRSYMLYRDDVLVPDKLIKRAIRNIVGYKPYNGYYVDLKMLNVSRESRKENRRLVFEANAQRKALLAEVGELVDVGGGSLDNENVDMFVRR